MAGFVGLAFSFALSLPTALGSVMWSISLMEQKMCSVQRVREVLAECEPNVDEEELQQEENQFSICSTKDLAYRSGIKFDNVEVSYQKLIPQFDALRGEGQRFAKEHLPPSLINITVEAKPGEHIGVVGRTGSGESNLKGASCFSGKSTLLLALLNLVPTSKGEILIDGVPLRLISRDVLQNFIGVLPQFPPLRRDWTIRKFLDPEVRIRLIPNYLLIILGRD